MTAPLYVVRSHQVERVFFWRGRRRVRWTKDVILGRCAELDEAKKIARDKIRRCGLAIAWITLAGRRAWTLDERGETTEKWLEKATRR